MASDCATDRPHRRDFIGELNGLVRLDDVLAVTADTSGAMGFNVFVAADLPSAVLNRPVDIFLHSFPPGWQSFTSSAISLPSIPSSATATARSRHSSGETQPTTRRGKRARVKSWSAPKTSE